MTDTLLIPSAGYVPKELRLDLGTIPSGLIPLHGRPAIEHIADSYTECEQCDELSRIVACRKDDKKVQNWTAISSNDWEVVELEDPPTLGHTVYWALEELVNDHRINGELYIQFADTIVYPPCYEDVKNAITFDKVTHPVRWTTFDKNDNHMSAVYEKFSPLPTESQNTFVGHFKLSDPEHFYQCLRRIHSMDTNKYQTDLFYAALIKYSETRNCDFIQANDWIDVGHLDTYHRAKTEFLNVRGFNEVEINEDRNVLRKRSSSSKVLKPEINWYQNIPESLQPYLPRVFEYSLSDDPYIELEYIGYPALSDIYMYGNHGIHIWTSIFESIFDIFDKFQQHRPPEISRINESLHQMYYEKTVSRLNRAKEHDHLSPFFGNDRIRINKRVYHSVPYILDTLNENLLSVELLDSIEPSIVHGDMCFANILCDARTGIIKLVDPRGEFGAYDIYGDQRYDLAKLAHSVNGKYEFIINDRFGMELDDTETPEINYTVYSEPEHQRRMNLFFSMLKSRFPDVTKQVTAIESLLWLSMVPLHRDSPERQKIMLSQGVKQYNDVFYRDSEPRTQLTEKGDRQLSSTDRRDEYQ